MTEITEMARKAVATAADLRWARVVARDRTADGSSGIRSRPRASTAGRPAPENREPKERDAARQLGRRQGYRLSAVQAVQPGRSLLEAQNAALRPRLGRQSEEPLSLADLAAAVGSQRRLLPSNVQGRDRPDPKATAAIFRPNGSRSLVQGQSVTATIYDSGFTSGDSTKRPRTCWA